MQHSLLSIKDLILYLLCFFLSSEGTFCRSWGRNNEINHARTSFQIKSHSNRFALTGYLASLMDYSYVVSYHYKESGRLFCSGFLISPHWTISVPNCFQIPTYYYSNRETRQVRKHEVDEYPYGSLSLKDSLTVKPKKYSRKELKKLKKVVSLKPEAVVVLTVFDTTYIPCESEYARTGSEIIIHSSYETISHNAEIALFKVADSLTSDFGLKIPSIGQISIEGDEPILCHVAGYGTLKLNRTIYSHPVLSVIDVEVFASNMCQTISKTYNVTIDADPSNYVCSYNRKHRYGSSLAQGDSGAPLICGENIVGVSQWVFSPDPGYLSSGPSQHTPHIYTKLGVYLPWILNHTEKDLDNEVRKVRTEEVVNKSFGSTELDSMVLIMFYFCLVTLLFLGQQIGKSDAAESCYCIPMESKNITNETQPLIYQPLKVLKDCRKEAEETCFQLCKSLATIAQYDPSSAKSFCAQLKKNVTNLNVSIFSKACDGEYMYTGLTFNKPICCTNKKPVPC